jgi:DNA-directed RNA polymerase subunit RPC12/RpoP
MHLKCVACQEYPGTESEKTVRCSSCGLQVVFKHLRVVLLNVLADHFGEPSSKCTFVQGTRSPFAKPRRMSNMGQIVAPSNATLNAQLL